MPTSKNSAGRGPKRTKFVFVIGGVISGVGKGIITASISRLLKSRGYSVLPVKIDPYINCDAGTMRPTEHGEVFVTEDGGETDEDLGHYERFLSQNVLRANNITTGQIFRSVIDAERAGKYLGRTVQPIPHVVDEIVRRIRLATAGADYGVVEIGGVVGDYENILFIMAMQKIALQEGREKVCNVLVAYMPVPSHLKEMKSKPTQHAISAMGALGAFPDFLVVRAPVEVDGVRREKIANVTNVPTENVTAAPDVGNVYCVPLLLEGQGLVANILKRTGSPDRKADLLEWKRLVGRMDSARRSVAIALIAKYIESGSFRLPDAYVSISQALLHAGAHLGIRPELEWINAKEYEGAPARLGELAKFDGIIGLPGFGETGVEGKIAAVKFAREKKIPYLGICYGMQLAIVEIARDVCGLAGAHTTECDARTPAPVVSVMESQKRNVAEGNLGGTMRLGSWPAILKEGTAVRKLYGGAARVSERHRHRYEVNARYVPDLEKAGVVFSGTSPDGRLMEFMELRGHPFFVGTQAHPEYKSRLLEPHPLYLGFLKAAAGGSSGAK